MAANQLIVDNGHISSDSAAGNAGHIGVTAAEIAVTNGASLSTIAQGGAGHGGNITLTAGTTLKVEGSGLKGPSNIQTDTLGSGSAGVIELTAPQIFVRDGGLVSSASLPGSTGPAGNITMKATDQLIVNAGSINTQSAQSLGGNITIGTPFMMKLYHGDITASATGGNGDGGNVRINSGYLLLNHGNVTAQAEGGDGGNLLITVNMLFIKSAESVLSASSRYGQQGTVVLNAPNTDVAAALKASVYDILNLNSFIPRRCMSPDELNASSFKLLGSDGLPAAPENSFPTL
jgi:large exoprotein involved in heme utilization and adhesion